MSGRMPSESDPDVKLLMRLKVEQLKQKARDFKVCYMPSSPKLLNARMIALRQREITDKIYRNISGG